ncbi:MAG: hypothetical protein HOB88_07475 [Bacteroidetes bacterium]|nr:hypothetical protein [Bacteroidota bacterium]
MKYFSIHISVFILVAILSSNSLYAQTKFKTSAKGQLSGWTTFNFSDEIKSQIGGRIIPTINFDKTFNSKLKLDAEFSLNSTGYLTYTDWNQSDQGESFKPYRLWLRVSGEKWEVRAGLQKINFGSASMLRPLMWFDQIDPRDPLQLTNGVYAILGRYYFKNNANLWLWTIGGRQNLKGWEIIKTSGNSPEYGGRFQFPFIKGELATSYNYRKTYNSSTDLFGTNEILLIMPEHKFGLDGKWDMKIGLWIESSYTHNSGVTGPPIALNLLKNRLYNNIGADYTFGIGNGLNVTYEQLFMTHAGPEFKDSKTLTFSILALNYPIGLLDNISVMVYYNWGNGDWYRFINFQRSYNNWSYHLMAFWNPDQFQLYNISDNSNLFAGKGFQLMTVYNF